MTSPEILGPLGGLHGMLRELVGGLSAEDAQRRASPELACPAWYLGRAVYRETYWLRQVLTGDDDLTRRVRHIFAVPETAAPCGDLAPPEHLLYWAQEIQDEHLRRLATPGELPEHPLLAAGRLPWFLLQEAARDYERLLAAILAGRLARPTGHIVADVLEALPPSEETVLLTQGHYRVGSRGEAFAYDHELPPQGVALSGCRMARRPVTNAEYLMFMEDGGYDRPALWSQMGSEAGGHWLAGSGVDAPVHWRRDGAGHWYGIGIAGPADLVPTDPVSGINRHEAAAFAAWVAERGGALAGAVLQHEYQWEVAARAGLIEGVGRAWEWCANPFHGYQEFSPFPDRAVSEVHFGVGASLRGAGLHTQRCLRRTSARNWATPGERLRFAGARLVFPPG